MALKKGINFKSSEVKKPSTAMRAGITAGIRYTSGKELVEHDPWELIPDPNNPRPNEVINEKWLKDVLLLGTNDSLCYMDEKTWIIPSYSELKKDLKGAKEDDYEFLRQLAHSIRNDGLIEPIEIFLADKNHEPEYFANNGLEYGYAILEGHQRRLAAMMAGMSTITCIKITDDTMLAKLGVRNRKLKRQLAENNLRKNLTVSQQYQITKKLFLDLKEGEDLGAEELSNLLGLNLKIAQCLRRLHFAEDGRYPSILFQKIEDNEITYKALRSLLSKPADVIEKELKGELIEVRKKDETINVLPKKKTAGRQKSYAKFQVKGEKDTVKLSNYLMNSFPDLKIDKSEDSPYKQLEDIFNQLLELANKKT